MSKLERNIEINAPSKKIWEVLGNTDFTPKWNFPVKEIIELEPNKYSVKSNLGDYTSNIIELIENERVSAKVDHPDFSGYGYILNEKGDITELTHWID